MAAFLQVANLSEEAARKIGANPLLQKVAKVLCHDIGKTLKPEFLSKTRAEGPACHFFRTGSAQVIISTFPKG